MAFSNLKYRFQEVSDRMENYVESTLDYYKLRLLKILSKVTISLLHLIVYGSLFLFVLLFLSIGAAFWLGTYFEEVYAGFLLIGGFYGFILILMFIFGRRMIERMILTNFSDLFYDEDRKNVKKETERDLDELELLIKEEAYKRENR